MTDWQIPEQDFPEAAANFDLTNDTIRAARSIVGLYNLPTNGKTVEDKITLIIQSKKAEIADMLQKQRDIIVALTKGCGTCKFISSDSEVPQGCGSEVVTADVTVHIPVQVSYTIRIPYKEVS
jgi:valyl-tRNA synthetase